MKQSLTIFIYNAVESELPFLTQIKDASTRDEHMLNTSCFADAFLFFQMPESSLFITPLPVDTSFQKYVATITGRTVHILTPHPKTNSICKNSVQDPRITHTILDQAKKHHNQVTLYFYAPTQEAYLLVDFLKKKGLRVYTPELPFPHKLTKILSCGTKSGCRKLFGAYMPTGGIYVNQQKAIEKAVQISQTYGAVVIKTDRGNAGDGTHILRHAVTADQLKKLFRKDRYWTNDPIVVEHYIDTTKSKTPFPSIEGYIDPQGKVHLPYYCTMSVTPAGEFYGVEIHTSVVSRVVKKKMRELTMMMGRLFAQKGYRGRFDVDYIYDGKKLYVGETNIRMNGGTDTYMLIRHLMGRSFFTSRFVISNFISLSQKRQYTFQEIQRKLEKLAYNPRTKTGVVIASANALALHGLSYILIGRSLSHARRLHKRLLTTIKNT